MLIILPISYIISSASVGGGEDCTTGYSAVQVVGVGASGFAAGAAGHYAYASGSFNNFITQAGEIAQKIEPILSLIRLVVP